MAGFMICDADMSCVNELEKLEEQCFSMPWTREQLIGQLPDDMHTFLVAKRDNRIIGYVGMMNVLDEGYISNVAVTEDCRRNGVADALLSEIDMRAREKALSFVTLEVRRSNTAAIGLYTKHGYFPVGERKNYYQFPTEDAILMTKLLK